MEYVWIFLTVMGVVVFAIIALVILLEFLKNQR